MVSVLIPALSGTASIGTAGLMDALNKADLAWALQAGPAAPRVFDVRLAGLDGGTVRCRDGVSLDPSVAAGEIAPPDLVVVPGLDDDLVASHPVDQVRRLAGYGDPAAFRRVFKQATGLSPSRYRDAYGLRPR